MRTFTRIALAWYTLRIDIVEVALRLFGRDVRRKTVLAATDYPETIVDLITGAGVVLPLYARRFPDARIIAVDLNKRLLGIVKKHVMHSTGRTIEIMDGDARELRIPALYADLVNISFGLHELKKLDRLLVLGESSRILKPGGQLIVADYREPKGFVSKIVMKIYFSLFEPRWVKELFNGGLEKQITEAGFEIDIVRDDLPMTRLFAATKPADEPRLHLVDSTC